MKERNVFRMSLVFSLFVVSLFFQLPAADTNSGGKAPVDLDKEIRQLMKDGDIPGLSLVIVKGDKPVEIKSYGYADLEKQVPVTPDTLFELCSVSKMFTGLAALKLESEGMIDLDAPVSKYLQWFSARFKGKKYEITLRQLLHHTSGIPWKTMALIPVSNADDTLQNTIKALCGENGAELVRPPGTAFEYATINYDVIGAVIESVTGMSYEDAVAKHVFQPLGMNGSRVGYAKKDPQTSIGHRISFFSPRAYDAPVYRANNPAGYVLSGGKDMARWLQAQMGMLETELQPMIEKSHQPDMSVLPIMGVMWSYAVGWQVSQYGSPLIFHGGLNPNFTTYIGFRPTEKVGVVVLANSNSMYTDHIARVAMDLARGYPMPKEFVPGRTIDGMATILTIGLGIFMLLVVLFIISIILDTIKGKRQWAGFSAQKLLKLVGALVLYVPFAFGIYLLPLAMKNLPWEVAKVWTPVSFHSAAILIVAAMGAGYIGSVVSSLFPLKNKYTRSAPLIIILSLLSGLANAVVIFLITSSLFSEMKLIYQIYFYVLAFFIYIVGRKVIQTRLTRITFQIVYDLRMRLVEKVFLTTYQRFEKLERGRVFATLNDDTGQIAQSANVFVGLITSIITSICAFIYLFTIAFWATAVTMAVVIAIATLYGIVSNKARKAFEQARDTRDTYMTLLNGLLDGFKELSLRLNKKKQYRNDVAVVSDKFSNTMAYAIIRFINAFLIGESLLLVILGAVSFAIPRLFPDITTFTLMSFIMILLYLIGPVNVILNAIPIITQIRVSWSRVKKFERDVPANIDPNELPAIEPAKNAVDRIIARGVEYKYESENEDEAFCVGPLDFEARKGEITFIIGGNGSGKTTLAKLLTGLYLPDKGYVQVEGKETEKKHLGEYFSTVFSDFHLFKKLYDVDLNKEGKEGEADKYINLLRLKDKVEIKDNTFSTVELSGGQKKRLALLQCYLEDAPIYLFDEVAADQDPEFRKFFYRDLLQKMKKEGKIIIAITHDDHYFDVADKIIKMDMGRIDTVDASYRTTAAEG